MTRPTQPKNQSLSLTRRTNKQSAPLIHHLDVSLDMVEAFDVHYRRLQQLERWRELAIRPATSDCHPDDCDLLREQSDDLGALTTRCLQVRALMNENLLPHELVLDEELIPQESSIPNSGLGLFYCPSPSRPIPEGSVVCHYAGQLHNFRSSNFIKDKSYLMLVSGDLLVDPGPQVKARYINDPIIDEYINCKFVPRSEQFCCAVVATRDIQPGEELFVSYGEAYWSQQSEQGTPYSPRRA